MRRPILRSTLGGLLAASMPGWAGPGLAGGGQPGLVRADGNGAAMPGGGAPVSQRARGADDPEPGFPGVTVGGWHVG